MSKKVLSIFDFLLWNHWANWNQTWKECSLGGSIKNIFMLVGSMRKNNLTYTLLMFVPVVKG
jgi:hypothetical protein